MSDNNENTIDISNVYKNNNSTINPTNNPMNTLSKTKENDYPIIIDGKRYQIYGEEYPLESYKSGVSRLKNQDDYDEIKKKFKKNNNIDELATKEAEKNPRLIEFKRRTKGPLDGELKKLFNNNKNDVVGGRRKSKKTKRKSLKKRRKTKRKSLKKRRRTRRR